MVEKKRKKELVGLVVLPSEEKKGRTSTNLLFLSNKR